MPVLLILVALVILVGVFVVAIGRGGEMAEFAGDYPPFETDDLLTAADVATLRPPTALWGYNAAATDQALGRIAEVVTERDVEIATLRKQLSDLRTATGTTTGSFGAIGSTGSFSAVRPTGSTGSFGTAAYRAGRRAPAQPAVSPDVPTADVPTGDVPTADVRPADVPPAGFPPADGAPGPGA